MASLEAPLEPPVVIEIDLLDQTISERYSMHSEYQNQWGLATIRAADAYARLEARDGAGTLPGAAWVRVVVIDSGVDLEHPRLNRDLLTETFLAGATDEDGTGFSHGTAVAGVIGARRGSSPTFIHGVAWGAQIDVYAIPLAGAGAAPAHHPVSICR